MGLKVVGLDRSRSEVKGIFNVAAFLNSYISFISGISKHDQCCIQFSSVADPDPGSGAFLTPGSGMGRKSASGSGMNNPDHIF
jgi:hypothetical protein